MIRARAGPGRSTRSVTGGFEGGGWGGRGTPGPRVTLGRTLSRGTWALADQGLFSVSNFGLNILLARWLVPVEYGRFTVAYTAFLFLATFYTAIVIEPMLVFGAGDYRDRFSSYLDSLRRDHRRVAAIFVSVVIVTVVPLGMAGAPAAPLVLSMGLATPSILFLWLVRKACYVLDIVHLAAWNGLLYLSLLGASALFLNHAGRLSPTSAMLALAACSGVCAVLLAPTVRRRSPSGSDGEKMDSEYRSRHMRYGGWASGTLLLGWLRRDVYYLLLVPWAGLQGVATLRAAMNLLVPYLQGIIALSTVLLPQFVRDRRAGKSRLRGIVVLSVVGAMTYAVALGLFGELLMSLVYAARYGMEPSLLLFIAIIPVPATVVAVLAAWLKANDHIRGVFRANALGTLGLPIVGIPAVMLFGTVGALGGMVVSYCAVSVFTWRCATEVLRTQYVPSTQEPRHV